MLIDKKKAIKKKWRISEQTLLSVSFIGGSLGAYLAMILFRHKTKHFKFKYGLPLMIIFHCFFFSIVIKKIVLSLQRYSLKLINQGMPLQYHHQMMLLLL